jgi:glycerol-3-phosphate cytidylyltransferase-like family protein
MAQTEPEVMLGTFNVHSTPATILFDSGASHTFIFHIFVKMHSEPMLAMKEPLLVNSPRGTMQTTNRCLPVIMVLRGVEFKITPIVLRTSGIDVILGMDWMKQNQAVIQCQQKVVVVNAPNGEKISVDVVV